jgi:hypothetical protein
LRACAAQLGHDAAAGRHHAIDAIVVATAEATPGRRVATGDPHDLELLATPAHRVRIIDYRRL